ncbi:MAG: deaminase domain-containing protein [Kiritimatiellia bacterium]
MAHLRRRLMTALFCGLAAAWLAGAAWADPPAPAAVERLPEIRLIEPGRDDPAMARIEIVRARLPEKNRRRNNFAWAVAQIEGLDKTEYYAHSGINGLGGLSAEAAALIPDVSPRCKKGRFEILCVNHADEIEGADCWPRYMDTECKILEDLAAHLPDPSAAGRVRLYTDLYPCASCRHVMAQFLGAYTNVEMQVLYRER